MSLQNGDICLVNGISGIYFNGKITLSNMTVTDQEPDYVLRFDGQETFPPEAGCNFPEVEHGQNGMYVAIMQTCLLWHGYRIKPDGVFGMESFTALREFRKDHYLTGDTVCDAQTWEYLLKT